MKLISLNIEVNRHFHTVLPFIKKENPDVVCLQELLENDFDFFKKELALDGAFQAFKYVNYKLYDEANGKKYGVAIFAKKIIDSGHVFYFGKEENILKSFEEHMSNEDYTRNSTFVWADVLGDDGKIYKFINTHLPVTREGESTPFQLENVDSLLKELNSFPEFVLCGDMNAPRGNESFSRLAKKYKDNIPLEYKTSIDQNLHRAKGLQYVVDGLFTTPTYKASSVRLVDGVSDHMAVVAEIQKENQ